ncbi:MAG: ABC transporter substrate-binding protein [Chloroflexi bacterium]|nr:ABC transporter substrate-binding protein [Chloroflexota bacterium]
MKWDANAEPGMSGRTRIARKITMKIKMKVLVLGLLAVAAMAIVACAGDDIQPEPTATVVPAATAVPSATVVPAPTSGPAATIAPAATQAPQPTAVGPDLSRFADVPEIVDPTNFGWPRSIESSEGVITIDAPPEKVHSLSLGHTEILAALMDFDRLTAVYSFFVDDEQSNIAELSASHNMIGFDPEEVVALEPDVIIASRFTNADTVALLTGAGIPVVRTALENSALGNVPNILLIGYMIGAEAEALALVEDIESRMQLIFDALPDGDKPRVLSVSKFTSTFAAGSNTTEGGIIEQAGGINAAADSGIEGHLQVSIESIAAISPDVILVPQPLEGANIFIEELMTSPALAEVPAIKNGEVHYVLPKYHTTLSHWNVRGIEQLVSLLFPSAFSDVTFEDFSNWVGPVDGGDGY